LDAPTTDRAELENSLAAGLPSREARWILEEVGVAPGGSINRDQRQRAGELARRRLAGEPLQYVLGHWPFRDLDLLVDRRALIPRPETEWVTDVALAELDGLVGLGRPARIVDLGTGTGAIALAIATERSHYSLQVTGTDLDEASLDVARLNEERVAERRTGSLRWRPGRWWDALDREERGTFTLVVANPPYVSPHEWESLDPVVRDHEPYRALVAGPGTDGTPGLADIEAILRGAPEWLSRPGVAAVEIAPAQRAAALRLAERLGCDGARVLADLSGRPRALVARWG
jgi:release factor glutamine methyltransferase